MTDRNTSGFTLVEVLVAMGIFAMILSLAAGSYWSTAQATRRTEDRLELISMGRIALDKIILEINGAVIDPVDFTKFPFVGENGGSLPKAMDELNFFTTSYDPRALGLGSNLAEIGFYIEKNQRLDTYFLQHRIDPFPDFEPRDGGIITDLAEQVAGLNFRYQDENESWSSRWDSTIDGELPRLVEITIVLEGLQGQTIQLRSYAAPMRWTPPKF